jgi:ATPase subunit of ABC transporter with duplicated ATPase domains
MESRQELAELEAKERPTFWIDKESVAELNYKVAGQYEKFKAKNVRIGLKSDESRSKHVLVSARDVALGYGDAPLFEGVDIDLREGEAMELRGRNGAGKTTLIKALLGAASSLATENTFSGVRVSARESEASRLLENGSPEMTKRDIVCFSGELTLDSQVRVGIYEQEVSPTYFDLPLEEAIERMYLDRGLAITTTKIRQLMSDYLFTEGDGRVPIRRLSGGQKARFQLIAMLANNPQLLILDEPTNHLDLPSIEELETALQKYSGAVLYVSHDNYFREKLGGEVVQIGAV